MVAIAARTQTDLRLVELRDHLKGCAKLPPIMAQSMSAQLGDAIPVETAEFLRGVAQGIAFSAACTDMAVKGELLIDLAVSFGEPLAEPVGNQGAAIQPSSQPPGRPNGVSSDQGMDGATTPTAERFIDRPFWRNTAAFALFVVTMFVARMVELWLARGGE